MRTRGKFRSSLVAAATALALTSLALVTGGSRPAAAAATAVTAAWHDGSFAENPAGVVSRSDVVIKQPNFSAAQFLPLGNGSLGVAAWCR